VTGWLNHPTQYLALAVYLVDDGTFYAFADISQAMQQLNILTDTDYCCCEYLL